MKKNKGFTLIELLAVIVILAIIALIASPIIIGLIDDARKEAAASSAHGILKASENVFAKVLMKSGDGLSKELKYEFGANGAVTISALTTAPDTWTEMDSENVVTTLGTGMTMESIQLDYNGTKPTEGSITIDTTGQATVVTDLRINNFNCEYKNKNFDCN